MYRRLFTIRSCIVEVVKLPGCDSIAQNQLFRTKSICKVYDSYGTLADDEREKLARNNLMANVLPSKSSASEDILNAAYRM